MGADLRTADLLRLAQWLSPAFPVSGYAYSHGLETAMAAGRVRDADTSQAWIEAVLRHGAGALDAWAIRAVLRGDPARDVADVLCARAGSAERWAETTEMGTAFAAGVAASEGGPAPDGVPIPLPIPLPVALARAAHGIPAGPVCALYLQAFAAQLVSAAVRFVPLGQGTGQAVVARLRSAVDEVAAQDAAEPPGTGALAAELDAMAHETLQPRIFRT